MKKLMVFLLPSKTQLII